MVLSLLFSASCAKRVGSDGVGRTSFTSAVRGPTGWTAEICFPWDPRFGLRRGGPAEEGEVNVTRRRGFSRFANCYRSIGQRGREREMREEQRETRRRSRGGWKPYLVARRFESVG